MTVTVLQTSQMAVGVAVQVATAYYVTLGKPCDVDGTNIQAGILMYGSYFLLFLQILVFKDYSAVGGDKRIKKESIKKES